MNTLRLNAYIKAGKRYLKIFTKYPISVLKLGFKAQDEYEYKRKILSKYKIEQLPTINLLDLCPDFNEDLKTYSYLEGTSTIIDLMLLKSLARKFKHCSYLEIGSWRGESIANVSDVTDDCTCVTLSDEDMRNLHVSEDVIRLHGFFVKEKQITTIRANSHTYDFNQLNKKFDLIFIDGDHSYEGVMMDTNKIFGFRKSKDSVIVWHDYGWNTEDVRFSVLNGILDGVPREKHENLFHVSNTMCAIYIEGKKFETEFIKFPSKPNKNFVVQVRAEKL